MLVGTFAFANIELTSNIDTEKIETLISVDNLDFQNFTKNDMESAITEYSLLPRFVLLKMEYRF